MTTGNGICYAEPQNVTARNADFESKNGPCYALRGIFNFTPWKCGVTGVTRYKRQFLNLDLTIKRYVFGLYPRNSDIRRRDER